VIVEINGFAIFGHHGVGSSERRVGQKFVFDITLDLPEPPEDSIDAAVDYRAVRDTVRAVSDAKAYNLLESLAAAAAEAVASRFAVDLVTVRVRKPGVAWADWTAASASRKGSAGR
jgi:dihydroneopterin aldolase